ncbi:MAG: endonuclease, partial [Bacteroidaceae bacterium]|nr:endonuclease [Bacteroidaceae bacterium]
MRKLLLHLIFVLLTICAAQAQELYVGTYNLRYKNSSDTDAGNGWNTRRTYLINLVKFQQPDLLGVQEALPAQMTDMRNGLTGYGSIGVGRNDGDNSGEYSAIFYRKER